MRNEKWRKILLAVGIAFAVLMAVMTLWARAQEHHGGRPGGEADYEGV